jgi:hypothetical protein
LGNSLESGDSGGDSSGTEEGQDGELTLDQSFVAVANAVKRKRAELPKDTETQTAITNALTTILRAEKLGKEFIQASMANGRSV